MVRRLLRPRYVGLALGVALVLGCFPAGVEAKMVGSMGSGAQELTPRQAREAHVAQSLAQEKVAKALASAGLKADQVQARLSQLSDQQLAQLAQNLDTIQSGKSTIAALAVAAVLLLAVLLYMQIEAA